VEKLKREKQIKNEPLWYGVIAFPRIPCFPEMPTKVDGRKMMKMQCLHWLWKWTNPKPARKEMLWKSLVVVVEKSDMRTLIEEKLAEVFLVMSRHNDDHELWEERSTFDYLSFDPKTNGYPSFLWGHP
jgi:hypothetical protein